MLKKIFAVLTVMLASFNVYAIQTIYATVPFSNIRLQPNQYIEANYSFGAFSVIYCYENNLKSVGVLAWPLNGKVNFATLSTFPLVKNTRYQGDLADLSGIIGITNNTSGALIVNCLYVF